MAKSKFGRWYQENSERRRAYMAQYREANRDKIRGYSAKWRAENRHLANARNRADYEKNKEAKAEYAKEYRAANPEKVRSHVRNRRARLKSVEGRHTAEDVQRQFEGQKGCCWWCGKKLKRYHVDHRIPIAEGGSNGPENIVIACPPCNQKKNRKMPWEMDNPRLL